MTGYDCEQRHHTGLDRLCRAHFSDRELREKLIGAKGGPPGVGGIL